MKMGDPSPTPTRNWILQTTEMSLSEAPELQERMPTPWFQPCSFLLLSPFCRPSTIKPSCLFWLSPFFFFCRLWTLNLYSLYLQLFMHCAFEITAISLTSLFNMTTNLVQAFITLWRSDSNNIIVNFPNTHPLLLPSQGLSHIKLTLFNSAFYHISLF